MLFVTAWLTRDEATVGLAPQTTETPAERFEHDPHRCLERAIPQLRSNENPFDPDDGFRPVRPVSRADPDDSFAPADLRKEAMPRLTQPVASLPKANVPRGERISPSGLDNDPRQNLYFDVANCGVVVTESLQSDHPLPRCEGNGAHFPLDRSGDPAWSPSR